jgi:diguanylate cyclase (GGDEF)-like protein/PAS domain S-box-containing protein
MKDPNPTLTAALVENSFDGICLVDRNGRVLVWNKGAQRITGHPPERVVGTDIRDNPVRYVREDGRELPQTETPLLASLKDGSLREVLLFFKHAEGYRVSTLARIKPLLDRRERVEEALMSFTDNKSVIAAHQRNQRVELTTLFDGLTGIGNRSHIESRIRYAIEDYAETSLPFGVLFADIDHFKQFNDTYGHPTGDKVLRFVANSLRQNLRVSDSCGRWGGEEFVALVADIHLEGLQTVAEKLRSVVERGGVEENGKQLKTTISIGAAMFCPGDTLESLIKRADTLMYRSKQRGRNRVSTED